MLPKMHWDKISIDFTCVFVCVCVCAPRLTCVHKYDHTKPFHHVRLPGARVSASLRLCVRAHTRARVTL